MIFILQFVILFSEFNLILEFIIDATAFWHSSISLESWRNRCGIITQESSLFRDTICNNIIVGREFDREKLLKAVIIANIRNEIEMLPKSYDTMIGENGRGVSEGQKQRILLARAVYDNPDYIFLDEMTSSLDINREDSVIDSLKSQMPNKTIIIVSHRPRSIINADNIIIIKALIINIIVLIFYSTKKQI